MGYCNTTNVAIDCFALEKKDCNTKNSSSSLIQTTTAHAWNSETLFGKTRHEPKEVLYKSATRQTLPLAKISKV